MEILEFLLPGFPTCDHTPRPRGAVRAGTRLQSLRLWNKTILRWPCYAPSLDVPFPAPQQAVPDSSLLCGRVLYSLSPLPGGLCSCPSSLPLGLFQAFLRSLPRFPEFRFSFLHCPPALPVTLGTPGSPHTLPLAVILSKTEATRGTRHIITSQRPAMAL